jgi:hypothetical protein
VPPTGIDGKRNSFLTPLVPRDEVDVMTTLGGNVGATSVEGLSSDGTITVTYNYTPVRAVPEAGGLALLAGLLLPLVPYMKRQPQR